MPPGLILLAGCCHTSFRGDAARRDTDRPLIAGYEVVIRAPRISLSFDLIRAFKDPASISWGGGVRAVPIRFSRTRLQTQSAFHRDGSTASRSLVVLNRCPPEECRVSSTGLAEFAAQMDAGTLRVLGISSAQRLPKLGLPKLDGLTLREEGVDVGLENWRSLVARARIGVSDDNRQYLEAAVAAIVRSKPRREALTGHRWNDRYLANDTLASFVATEKARVQTIHRHHHPIHLGHTAAYQCYDTTQPEGVGSIRFFSISAVTVQTRHP